MEYDNSNSFVLFTNNKKETDKHPDYTGKVILEDGKELRLAAWLRESKSGTKFISGKVSEFQERQEQPAQSTNGNDDGSDLPF
jgi:uncharacterized protein (DUF736 family)